MLAINEANRNKKFTIPIHLALGHEAIAVALTAAKQPADNLLLSHRNIHYNIANQRDTRKIYDEYALQPEGQSGGRHGSMNLTNPDKGLIYTSSILGNNLCVASGVAMGSKVKEDGGVTFVVTGDGAMEEGAFYESCLMMKSMQVPLVLIIENNGWSMYTQIHERRCSIDIQKFAESLGIPYSSLQGNDVVDYKEKLAEIRKTAQDECSPQIVEVGLYTLGDFWTEDKPEAPSRLINYHHGVAPKINIAEWPELEGNVNDPVHILGNRFDKNALTTSASTIYQQITEVLQ
jgi:pyruvate dehydrogenase E1 component alpha subunit